MPLIGASFALEDLPFALGAGAGLAAGFTGAALTFLAGANVFFVGIGLASVAFFWGGVGAGRLDVVPICALASGFVAFVDDFAGAAFAAGFFVTGFGAGFFAIADFFATGFATAFFGAGFAAGFFAIGFFTGMDFLTVLAAGFLTGFFDAIMLRPTMR